MAGGHDRAESGTAAPGTRCTTVDGVTLEVTVASDFVRVRVRRSAGRAGSVASWAWALLNLYFASVLTTCCILLAVHSWGHGPLAGSWLGVAFLVFLLTLFGRRARRDAFHRLCGEDEVELRAGSATVRRRSAIGVEERSFPCADEVIGLRVEFVSWVVRLLGWKDPPRGAGNAGPVVVGGPVDDWIEAITPGPAWIVALMPLPPATSRRACRIGFAVRPATLRRLLEAAGADASGRLVVGRA